jgi:hypothetical protein
LIGKKLLQIAAKLKKKTLSKANIARSSTESQPLPAALQWLNSKPNFLK